MTFEQATAKAGVFGVAREDHRYFERRAVLLNGRWMRVEGDDAEAIFPVPQEDLDAKDWFPLKGDEWAMVRSARAA